MTTNRRIKDEALPNGGDYAIVYFQDADGSPVPESQAVRMEAIEYNKSDKPIAITFIDVLGVEDGADNSTGT